MKVKLGLPSKNRNKEDELLHVGWKKTLILEDMTMLIIQSVPLMAVGALVPYAILNSFGSYAVNVTNTHLVLAVVLGLILHEFFHVLLMPQGLKARNLTFGIYSGGTYSYFDGVMTKERYLWMTSLPFIILSMILPLFAAMTHQFSAILFVLTLFNGVTSALDFHTFFKVLFKVPRKASITTNGMEIFYSINF